MGKKSKFRRRLKGKILPKRSIVPIKPNKQVKEAPLAEIRHKFYLTDSDREIYCYAIDNKSVVQKVVDVSYEVNIRGAWITIVRYDSKHGYLHRHMRVSLENPSDTPTTGGVIRRGNPHKWLTWARKDISNNYLNYRIGFFKRSKIENLY